MPKEGTIRCVICELPAIGAGLDKKYYCSFHMRQKYGFLVPQGAV